MNFKGLQLEDLHPKVLDKYCVDTSFKSGLSLIISSERKQRLYLDLVACFLVTKAILTATITEGQICQEQALNF